MVAPNPQTTGIKEKPCARFVGSVSSPITLFITPDRTLVELGVEVQTRIRTYIAIKQPT